MREYRAPCGGKRTAAAATSTAFTEFPRQLPHRVHFLDNRVAE